jgi:hypothetical protein
MLSCAARGLSLVLLFPQPKQMAINMAIEKENFILGLYH